MRNRLNRTYGTSSRIFPVRLLLITLALIAVYVPVLCGQATLLPRMALQIATPSSSIPKDGKVRVFDVATVRLNKIGADNDKLQFTPDGFLAENVSLQAIIVAAYHLRDPDLMAGTRLIPGAPNWIKSDRYDLHAKMADSDIAELKNLRPDQQLEEKRLMLQSLLADRFKLTVHRETKEAPVYALIVAKNGSNLKRQPDDSPTVYAHSDRTHITYRAAPLSDLAARLAFLTGRPVLDQTGLAGKYDFTMSWAPDQSQSQMSGPGAAQEAPAPLPDSSGPSIFTALQEQLGLKLESRKGPVEILVIDHVERPSEN